MIVILHKYDEIIHKRIWMYSSTNTTAYLGIFKSMTKYDESYLHKNEYDKVVFCRTNPLPRYELWSPEIECQCATNELR